MSFRCRSNVVQDVVSKHPLHNVLLRDFFFHSHEPCTALAWRLRLGADLPNPGGAPLLNEEVNSYYVTLLPCSVYIRGIFRKVVAGAHIYVKSYVYTLCIHCVYTFYFIKRPFPLPSYFILLLNSEASHS